MFSPETMKIIRIVLLVLIIIGFILLGTQKYWVDPLVQFILKDSPKESVETPTNSGVSGKIDINAVCEGSLSYKTFPDGASADKFVSECKEGKHPDVIEQYIDSLGIPEAVI